jgi:predicted Zn finger-like uncharacterized protein
MRLICPNCDAQYEVDDAAIPETGRDVQCSNCGNAWFQERERRPEDATADLYREPEEPVPEAAPEAIAQREAEADEDDDETYPPQPQVPPVKRALDESILSVLREEAEREIAARRAEATGVEVQGDLGLPPPVKASVAAMAPPLAMETEDEPPQVNRRIAAMKGQKLPPEKPAARRDLLPDIEEINSTLRPNDKARVAGDDDLPDLKAKSSGFKSGLALMLLLAVLLVALYVMAPQISQQIPGAADAMASYVAAVDAARLWLDGMIRKATQLLNGITNPPA